MPDERAEQPRPERCHRPENDPEATGGQDRHVRHCGLQGRQDTSLRVIEARALSWGLTVSAALSQCDERAV